VTGAFNGRNGCALDGWLDGPLDGGAAATDRDPCSSIADASTAAAGAPDAVRGVDECLALAPTNAAAAAAAAAAAIPAAIDLALKPEGARCGPPA